MQTITVNGKDFPIRNFIVQLVSTGELMEITIGTDSLHDIVNTDNGTHPDGNIDDGIYFYVPDDIIYYTAESICAFYLDEPMELASEVKEVKSNTTVTPSLFEQMAAITKPKNIKS